MVPDFGGPHAFVLSQSPRQPHALSGHPDPRGTVPAQAPRPADEVVAKDRGLRDGQRRAALAPGAWVPPSGALCPDARAVDSSNVW
jgi:hypothetical protein